MDTDTPWYLCKLSPVYSDTNFKDLGLETCKLFFFLLFIECYILWNQTIYHVVNDVKYYDIVFSLFAGSGVPVDWRCVVVGGMSSIAIVLQFESVWMPILVYNCLHLQFSGDQVWLSYLPINWCSGYMFHVTKGFYFSLLTYGTMTFWCRTYWNFEYHNSSGDHSLVISVFLLSCSLTGMIQPLVFAW